MYNSDIQCEKCGGHSVKIDLVPAIYNVRLSQSNE